MYRVLFAMMASQASVALAGFLSPILTQQIGWQRTSLVAAGACIALVVALQPLRREMDSDRLPGSPLFGGRMMAALRLVLRHPMLRRLAAASGAFAAMQFCFMSLFVAFAVERTGLSLVAVGSALSIGLVVSVFGRLGGGGPLTGSRRGMYWRPWVWRIVKTTPHFANRRRYRAVTKSSRAPRGLG